MLLLGSTAATANVRAVKKKLNMCIRRAVREGSVKKRLLHSIERGSILGKAVEPSC